MPAIPGPIPPRPGTPEGEAFGWGWREGVAHGEREGRQLARREAFATGWGRLVQVATDFGVGLLVLVLIMFAGSLVRSWLSRKPASTFDLENPYDEDFGDGPKATGGGQGAAPP